MLLHKHLIIDGYNIIHAWPKFKEILVNIGPNPARTHFADFVRVIHDNEKIRVTIVFDGKGKKIEIERPTPETSFSLLYSPSDLSADGLIQRLVQTAQKKNEITVATQDSALAHAIESMSAIVISPDSLLDWVHTCENKQKQDVKTLHNSVKKKWKNHSLWDKLGL